MEYALHINPYSVQSHAEEAPIGASSIVNVWRTAQVDRLSLKFIRIFVLLNMFLFGASLQ